MTDAATLRAQAERLQQQAAEADRQAALAEQRRQQMTPTMRVAELLHDEFSWNYGGEDPWYYEIPSGANAEERWKDAWRGKEHVNFLHMAGTLQEALGYDTSSPEAADATMKSLERTLLTMAQVIGRTAGFARQKEHDSIKRGAESRKQEAIGAVEKAIEAAVKASVLT